MRTLTTLIQITLYPTAILIKKASIERKRESIEFQIRALFGMKHNMYAFSWNNDYLLNKIG